MKYILAMILCVALLAGCDTKIADTDYFPLHQGLQWDYKITRTLTGQKTTTSHFRINNLGPVSLKGEYADEPVSVRRTSDGTDYYILQDDTGTYRVGKRTLIEYHPRFDEKLVRVLPNYKDLQAGRNWSSETKPYVLYSTPGHPTRNPQQQRFTMAYEVVATGEQVSVAAGTYDNCLRIQGTAEYSFYADPRLGSQTIIITQTEWYAPGVGLIKLIRNEPLDLEMFKGGQIVFELTDFSH